MSAEHDAEVLYKAMKGLGTDDKVLSEMVAQRSRDQLQSIKTAFFKKYGKTLEEWIKGETSGYYEDLLLSLLEPREEYDAHLLKNAVKGLGTDDHQLIEVICTRTNQELHIMKEAYKRLYKTEAHKDVSDDTSGDYKNLLLAILKGERNENQQVDVEAAKHDAQKLYKAGEGKIGTDEATFIEILSKRSNAQLAKIAEAYGSLAGHSLESGVSKETSGNFKKALTVLITPKDEYFADEIHSAIAGVGTDDKRLIRCVSYLSNSSDYFRAVNNVYMHKYKHNIANDVGGDTSGWFKKTAVAVISSRVNL